MKEEKVPTIRHILAGLGTAFDRMASDHLKKRHIQQARAAATLSNSVTICVTVTA